MSSFCSQASELQAQLQCVTEERQLLLGDNEAAQTLQEEVDQLRAEIVSLAADRQQLEERLREEEKKHSEEVQELRAEKEQQTAAAVESSEELERLRSDLGALDAQRAELQDTLQEVREEKSQLQRDLEENVDMVRNCISYFYIFIYDPQVPHIFSTSQTNV